MTTAFAQGCGGSGGGTLTSVIRDRHQAKAAYRLLDHEQVTHEAVIAGHCQLVREAMATPGEYLLIEDTTAISYPNRDKTTGLGPIGESHTRGLWAHQTPAVKADWQRERQELLGLLGQRVWARPQTRPADRPPSQGPGKETDHQRQLRKDRESKRWMAALSETGGPAAGAKWTYVADRESDIYEWFQEAASRGWSYVIRATHPRALVEFGQGPDARRLGALIGILSVVAVFLLQQKLAARTDPQAPLEKVQMDPSMLAVLEKVDPPRGQPTRRWFWIAIAKLGGYHDRRSTDPGWLALWRGWQTLMILTRGYDLARGP